MSQSIGSVPMLVSLQLLCIWVNSFPFCVDDYAQKIALSSSI